MRRNFRTYNIAGITIGTGVFPSLVFVNEFGCFSTSITRRAAARMIHDARKIEREHAEQKELDDAEFGGSNLHNEISDFLYEIRGHESGIELCDDLTIGHPDPFNLEDSDTFEGSDENADLLKINKASTDFWDLVEV